MPTFPSVLCLLALALSGCHLVTESGNPLVASLSASRRGIADSPSRRFAIAVTILNTGRRNADTADPASYCGHHIFRVFGADDREVALPPLGVVCTLELRGPITLSPGQSVTLRGEWIAAADLPSGAYRLLPRVWGASGEIPATAVSVTLD
jgi:hypothetical protein